MSLPACQHECRWWASQERESLCVNEKQAHFVRWCSSGGQCTLGQASFEVHTKRSDLEPVLTGCPEAGPSCGSCDSLHWRKMAAEGGAWIILGRTNSISGFFVSRGRTPGLGGRLHTYSFRQSNTEQDGSVEESGCAEREPPRGWRAAPRPPSPPTAPGRTTHE